MKRAPLLGAMGFLASLAASVAVAAGPGASSPASEFANPLLDTVVRMTRAEVPTPTILAYLRVRRVRLQTDIDAEDLDRLRREGVADEVIQYISKESGVEILPPLPSPPEREKPRPADPDRETRPRPKDPDPGDTGLIMGVYDPIPTDGYPCWPPNLAPYECGGGPVVVVDGPRSRGREERDKSRSPNHDNGRSGGPSKR